MLATLNPGTLICASAYPELPFDDVRDGTHGGFDVELMTALCAKLGLRLETLEFTGSEFTALFDELASGEYDAVISATTAAHGQADGVCFSSPYLEFGQGILVNAAAQPNLGAVKDLRGLTAGVQSGNTAEIVARRYLAEGLLGKIERYPHDAFVRALEDLESGAIDLVIKLAPIAARVSATRPNVRVAFIEPTKERLGIAFASDNTELRDAFEGALAATRADGTFANLTAAWFSTASEDATS